MMRRLLVNVILVLCWAFPLAAQEMVETCAGVVERRQLLNGANAVLQPLANRPVVALSLVFPWGRSNDPLRCDWLNRILARSTPRYPGGSLLLRLEEIGGLSSYRTGHSYSSWTLVVPRGYAAWALQLQLDRLRGPWLNDEDIPGLLAAAGAPTGVDPTSLQTLFGQLWNPGQAVLAITGGFDDRETRALLSKVGSQRGTDTPKGEAPLSYQPGRLAFGLTRLGHPRQRAAAYLWQSALREQALDVQLDLDPAEQHDWLSTALAADTSPDLARPALLAALPAGGLVPTVRTRHKAVQRWLEEWDDLGSRSRLLALEQARGELGRSLQTYEALIGYDLTRWRTDLAPLDLASARTEVTPPPPPPRASASAAAALKSRPGPAPGPAAAAAPPPFVRLEYAPNCGALIQTVSDLPVVAVRALIPGGAASDPPSLAGRAEWLGAYWQQCLDPAYPTSVETQSFHWQFSAYLPRDQVTPWLTRFFQLLNQPKLDATLADTARPRSPHAAGAVQEGYQEWLRLLFPPEHPLGRLGVVTAPTVERLQELQSEVRQRARWNLFLSGDVTSQEVELSLTQTAPPQPPSDLNMPANWDNLPIQPQLPGEAVVKRGEVKNCTLLLGGCGPARREADYYAFVLLMQALAGDPLRSRLQLELRLKRPLAERVEVNFLSSTAVSPWLVRVECARQNLPDVQSKLTQTLAELRQKELRPEELELAVRRLEGQQQVANVNSTGRVQQLRNLELFRLSDSYNQGFAGIYRNVTTKDLLASAKVRLLPQRLATLVITPKE